jgi:hypothetical protein
MAASRDKLTDTIVYYSIRDVNLKDISVRSGTSSDDIKRLAPK